MIRTTLAALLVSCSACVAADFYITTDSQFPSKATTIDSLFVGDEGSLSFTFKNNGTLRTVTSNETVTFWYGTNDLYSTAIVSLQTNGTNVIHFNSTNFPAASPSLIGYYLYGVNIGNKVYGTGRLVVKPNPSSGDPSDLDLRSSIDWGMVARYMDGLTGPYRAGSNVTGTTNADGSVTFSVDGVQAEDWQSGWGNTNDWNTAYSWGDHSTEGYVTGTVVRAEVDPVWGAVSNVVTAGAAAGALALPVAGGTVTGPVLTTRDFTATAPASDEFPSASWVRSLAMQGAEWFLSGTATNWSGRKTANFVAMQATNPAQLTNTVASPVLSNTYLLGGITTNTYGSLRSPVTFEIYANRNGGNTSSIIPLHPELYYIYNGTTNHLGDWETANQNITATTPTRYMFTVAFTEPTITGAVHVVAYMKSGTVSGTAAGLRFYGGGVYPSHIDIDGVPAGETAADVAANLTAHIADPTDAHDASAISATGIWSNVQAAITGLTDGKQPLDADLTRLAGNDGSALVYPTNIYTVAANATGTNQYYIVPGTINHIRMLATNATLKIWTPSVAGAVRSFARLEVYNPNLRPLIWSAAVGTIYWASNGIPTTTAMSMGKFGVASIYTGSTSHEMVRYYTNSVEMYYP